MDALCIVLHDAGVVWQVPGHDDSGYSDIASQGRRWTLRGSELADLLEHFDVLARPVPGGRYHKGKHVERDVGDVDVPLDEEHYVIGPGGYPHGLECKLERLEVLETMPGLLRFRAHYGDGLSELVFYSGNYSILGEG